MTTVNLLRDTQQLIEDKRNWTTGAFARNPAGNSVGTTQADASCWCAIGALQATAYKNKYSRSVHQKAMMVLDQIARRMTDADYDSAGSVEKINDNYGHGAVMRLYDQAIESLTPSR